MINIRYFSKNFFDMNKCGFVLLSTGICLTFSGCDNSISSGADDVAISSICTTDDFVVLTDECTEATDVDIVESKTGSIVYKVDSSVGGLITSSSSIDFSVEQVTDPTEEVFSESFYMCSNGYSTYEVKEYDTLCDLSGTFGVYEDDLKRINDVDYVFPGDVISVPIHVIKYFINADKSVSDVSIETGISIDEICELNNVPVDFVFARDYGVIVKKLFLSESSYDTELGVANLINDRIIFGDKVVQIENKALVLKNNFEKYGFNDVYLYSFEGNDYSYEHLFANVKDIDFISGVPVAYIRTYADIDCLVDYANYYGYSVFYDDMITVNYKDYSIFLDSNKDLLYTFDNQKYDFDDYDYSYGEAYSRVY